MAVAEIFPTGWTELYNIILRIYCEDELFLYYRWRILAHLGPRRPGS